MIVFGKILGILLCWGFIHYGTQSLIDHYNDFEGCSISKKVSWFVSTCLTVVFFAFCYYATNNF